MKHTTTSSKATDDAAIDLIVLTAVTTREQARALYAGGWMEKFAPGVAVVRVNWSPALDGASDPYAQGRDATPGTVYAYLKLRRPRKMSRAQAGVIEARWQTLSGDANARASRLARQLEIVGASPGLTPVAHYIVEMDPEAGWEEELFAWYDEEHMPGLAAVPGCIHAVRLLNLDHGPLNLACYDLTAKEIMGCPPWLAVRHSKWSDRVRPHFTNARRTMFEVIA